LVAKYFGAQPPRSLIFKTRRKMLQTVRQKLYEKRLNRSLRKAERQLVDLEIEINRLGQIDEDLKGDFVKGAQIRTRLIYLTKLHERYTRSFQFTMEILDEIKEE
jgi:hypothetical protein